MMSGSQRPSPRPSDSGMLPPEKGRGYAGSDYAGSAREQPGVIHRSGPAPAATPSVRSNASRASGAGSARHAQQQEPSATLAKAMQEAAAANAQAQKTILYSRRGSDGKYHYESTTMEETARPQGQKHSQMAS